LHGFGDESRLAGSALLGLGTSRSLDRPMYPELFTIFGYTISTFGLMLAIAFLVGSWITGVRMEEEGLDREQASTLLIYVIVGGVLGSKLYFAVDVSIRDGRPFSDLFFQNRRNLIEEKGAYHHHLDKDQPDHQEDHPSHQLSGTPLF